VDEEASAVAADEVPRVVVTVVAVEEDATGVVVEVVVVEREEEEAEANFDGLKKCFFGLFIIVNKN
jgi:hypothetical protein